MAQGNRKASPADPPPVLTKVRTIEKVERVLSLVRSLACHLAAPPSGSSPNKIDHSRRIFLFFLLAPTTINRGMTPVRVDHSPDMAHLRRSSRSSSTHDAPAPCKECREIREHAKKTRHIETTPVRKLREEQEEREGGRTTQTAAVCNQSLEPSGWHTMPR